MLPLDLIPLNMELIRGGIADDTVLIADSEENLQRLLDITIEKSEEMGLTLNVKKTECMVISKKSNSSLM